MTDDRKRKTGGEVELLPLPEPMQMTWKGPEGYDDEMMESYARANVDRALAESRAEVTDLRRWLGDTRAENYGLSELQRYWKARAERLAGALREVDEYLADREDVIDGDYGRPEANDEMRLRQVVSAALNLEPRND